MKANLALSMALAIDNTIERVERADRCRTRARHHRQWLLAAIAGLLQHTFQLLRTHPPLVIHINRENAFGPHPQNAS